VDDYFVFEQAIDRAAQRNSSTAAAQNSQLHFCNSSEPNRIDYTTFGK